MAGRVWAAYLKALQQRPIVTNIMTGGTLGFVGDTVCQKVVERQERMDWRRCMAMTTFGTCYSGFVNYFVYRAYSRLLPEVLMRTPLREGVTCSMVDNFLHVPFFYTPAFYIITEGIQGNTFEGAIDSFRRSGLTSIVSCWAMWLPYQAVTFSAIAPSNRTAFTNMGNLVWNVILDFIASNAPDEASVLVKAEGWSEEKPGEGMVLLENEPARLTN
mmetsp:Transcript_16481/g.35540  ORF Transcript_16481/g.35540 Transcript_16481/m.35540 type:complete len:216 (-) Transcript_16481:226-873(-)|eukprot:CAMPEP_0206534798 /NCGR_PEP_ID=MMETSP0325_2-20121206/5753_1 /ASSEMBLY_ACC=CAM_ASM_000347 /TAXON_ID=2866 /ORGANISM="Crypthecodinium cohnii, Strain Seligo" /LENGTH=215 /DNA_ID=CAMNT_0054031657 /DNA_START=57 /DNA_END=704 /DNA_ORIENTATION=+